MDSKPSVPQDRSSITDVDGVRVGHFTHPQRPTGCTVVLTEAGAVAGVDVRGSAPGTRETDLLNPVNTVQKVHAVLLAGGSAFGLDAATGVVRYLRERNIGFPTAAGNVPIVPAAILYDLALGNPSIWPDADAGYAACVAAGRGPVEEGNAGAGAGATVGKLLGLGRAMKGGCGTSSIRVPSGIVVGALVAVNAVGDVVDPRDGSVVAGARSENGSGFVDMRQRIRSGWEPPNLLGGNTTLAVVATNARLTKVQMTKVAQMAQDGLARTIYPAHTPSDGDVVFALSTGTSEARADTGTIGALAGEVLADAVLRAVRQAASIAGFPGLRRD